MVEHVPTGTPITDPELIEISRKLAVGHINQVFGGNYGFGSIISSEPLEHLVGRDPKETAISYLGVLDEKYSVYGGNRFNRPIFLVVLKEINPDTHDVYIRWVEIASTNGILKMRLAVAATERKEVMKW